MEKFIYNEQQTRGKNYSRWKNMNDSEREYFNEDILTEEQAVKIFDKLFPESNYKEVKMSDNWRKGTIWDKNNWSYDANGMPINGDKDE
jgi:hypothetical protein|tara:strand:+ start:2151 stop:2417 length:267 start_codon:yes stop_codon:yes gene_type:complete